MKIYTRTGDRGTTALLAGGRVRKDHPAIETNGTVDEAQAFLGAARAECQPDTALDRLILSLETDLWILMAEVATEPNHREGLRAGETAVTAEMVARLEQEIDHALEHIDLERGFAVPGGSRCSAALDVARTVVRRAERLAVGLELPDSQVVSYLNRLSDLCWALARSVEIEHRVQRREPAPTDEER
ncbi:MAG: ATP/cobalamin adenosyltransferase [Acidimicrobiaceae bacterium]|nr:ATP/cobalamin adenosyltransferase [Acidimicrobiaceae bacterium]